MSTIETDADRNLGVKGPDDEIEDREPRAIEREIDATRADMRATLEALERRFSFDRLVDLTVGRIRERGGEFAGNLTDAATQNPVPLLLVSVGVAWLMLTSRSGKRDDASASYSTSPGYRERMGNVRERAAHAADTAYGAVSSTRESLKHAAESSREALRTSRDTLEQTAESLREGASRAAAIARERVDDARGGMDRLLHEQPLMLGALGLAAGAIIGALLPTTEQEGQFLGETRDKTLKNAADKGRALYETARDRAATYLAPERKSSDESASQGPAPRPH
jgi:ElaB/YqjD/DUF883 family membrane-anchored ribosome-binding protein